MFDIAALLKELGEGLTENQRKGIEKLASAQDISDLVSAFGLVFDGTKAHFTQAAGRQLLGSIRDNLISQSEKDAITITLDEQVKKIELFESEMINRRSDINRRSSELAKDEKNIRAADPTLFEKVIQLEQEYRSLTSALKSTSNSNDHDSYTELLAEAEKCRKKLNRHYKKQRQAVIAYIERKIADEITGITSEEYNNAVKERDRLKSYEQKLLLDQLIALSPVSQEDAEAWANKASIPSAVINKVRRAGYPERQLRQDMAEFHRLTQGRLSERVFFKSIRSDRSSHTAGYVPGTSERVSVVNVGSGFSKAVLWHELAHHYESVDSGLYELAINWIKERSYSDEVRPLRSITGSKRYGSHEMALEGNFFSPYVGKIYEQQATEVFSMGIEMFSDSVLLAKLEEKDPGMMELIAGILFGHADVELFR